MFCFMYFTVHTDDVSLIFYNIQADRGFAAGASPQIQFINIILIVLLLPQTQLLVNICIMIIILGMTFIYTYICI